MPLQIVGKGKQTGFLHTLSPGFILSQGCMLCLTQLLTEVSSPWMIMHKNIAELFLLILHQILNYWGTPIQFCALLTPNRSPLIALRKKIMISFFLYLIFKFIHCSPITVEVTLKLNPSLALAAAWALKQHPHSQAPPQGACFSLPLKHQALLSAHEVFLSLVVLTAPDTHYKQVFCCLKGVFSLSIQSVQQRFLTLQQYKVWKIFLVISSDNGHHRTEIITPPKTTAAFSLKEVT